ncbi:MAG: Uncharacterised protein [Owenweeksia sp. TMED14]|nr:MAG: Uncharacterised protein [Owenweeksia sp. TMED14]
MIKFKNRFIPEKIIIPTIIDREELATIADSDSKRLKRV